MFNLHLQFSIRKKNPLFAITGHVCFHTCETKCARNEVDEPVNINAVERYLGDLMLSQPAERVPTIFATEIAIIGSGPAGLAAAYALAEKGYPITVFEADDKIGGMLRTAIPTYRLPDDVLDKQIKYIEDTGATFKTNTAFGKDITLESLRKDGYACVLIATGAPKITETEIEGMDLKGVHYGLEFVQAIKRKENVVGQNVIVIGGGNAAIDAALSAKKCGAEEVSIVYRRTKEEMPASTEEIELAEAEGVYVLQNWSPDKIVGENGAVTGVEFTFSVPNVNIFGHSSTILDDEKKQILNADTVVLALGEEADLSVMPSELQVGESTVAADPVTMATNLEGVFTAGTVGTPTNTVAAADGSAMEAVEYIERFIRNEDLAEGRGKKTKKVIHPPKDGVELKKRLDVPVLPVEEREKNFEEIKQTFSDIAADYEARRCMGCGSKAIALYDMDCQCCEACEWDCPNEATNVAPEKTAPLNVSFR